MTPPPMRLAKPRMLTSRPLAMAVAIPEPVVASATPVPPSVGATLQLHTLADASLKAPTALRNSQPGQVLRDALATPEVLRQVLLCVADPSASDLMTNARDMPEEQRADVARKLLVICSDLLLETSQRSNTTYRLILEHGLLRDLWLFVEQPAPTDAVRANHFKLVVDRLLRRARDWTLAWIATPWVGGGADPSPRALDPPGTTTEALSARAEAIRSMPVFRLFRHLESDHIAGLLCVALEREAEATLQDDKAVRSAKPSTRWSNKFDLVRVLLHKMKVGPLDAMAAPESAQTERTACNASMLLIEVLKHSNTHVDLLKNVLQAAAQLFQVALGLGAETFHPVQFDAAWAVIMELARALSLIWLPQRPTRLITESIKVFQAHMAVLRDVFVNPPDARPPRMGFVRLRVAELVALFVSGRLVSLFVEPLRESGLLAALLDGCWSFPCASIYHHTVFGKALLPMIVNCLALPSADAVSPAPALAPAPSSSSAEVSALAAAGVVDLLHSVRIVARIAESHYSYDVDTQPLRNRFAHNGFLTQTANALLSSTFPADAELIQFVNAHLDWTNQVENSPITSCVFSARMEHISGGLDSALVTTTTTTVVRGLDVEDEDLIPPSSPSSSEEEEEEDEDEDHGDAADTDYGNGHANPELDLARDPKPVTLSPARVAVLAVNPVLSAYNSPPRPRIALDAEPAADHPSSPAPGEREQVAASLEAVEDTSEDLCTDFAFWSIPVNVIEL